jgi:hypothetical protein
MVGKGSYPSLLVVKGWGIAVFSSRQAEITLITELRRNLGRFAIEALLFYQSVVHIAT